MKHFANKNLVRYELTPEEIEVVKQYLSGELSSRGAGEKLGISHQQVINLVSSLAREWYRNGLIKI